MDINEVLEFAKSNEEFSNALKENFTVEKEVTKEVPAQLNDDVVSNYLKENQSFSDKLYDIHRKKVYGKLLGKEEITEDDLKTKFVPESSLQEWQNKYSTLEKESVVKDKYGKEVFEALKPIMDFSKIQKQEDGTWSGLEGLEAFANLKTPKTPNNPIAQLGNVKTEEQKKQEATEKAIQEGMKNPRLAENAKLAIIKGGN
jgi:hypothetical protein